MKKDIHPDNFREVIFLDTTSGEKFLVASTVETEETDTYEGEEYPLYRIEMSSASHPFYTGVEQVVDTAGRVEKFKARTEARNKSKKKPKKKAGSKKKQDNKSKEAKQKDFADVKAEIGDQEDEKNS